MYLALSCEIAAADAYAEHTLGVPVTELMGRSGLAVANAVRKYAALGSRVIIFAGGGNNGGDGYAAALELLSEYDTEVVDLFNKGQRSDAGKYYLNKYKERKNPIIPSGKEEILALISGCDCIVDAVFGTGMHGEPPREALGLLELLGATRVKKIAVDVPLGVDADTGRVHSSAVKYDATVALSYLKVGLVSYPAREYCGEIMLAGLDLPSTDIARALGFKHRYTDSELARELLPSRPENSNKGSFGRLLCIVGSEKFKGAAHLAIEGALRGGVGYVTEAASSALISHLLQAYPEVIYKDTDYTTAQGRRELLSFAEGSTAVLIGSGCGASVELAELCKALMLTEGAPLILDADAINSLSSLEDGGRAAFLGAKRKIILTPHPAELSRLIGVSVSQIQADRISVARRVASEYGVTLLLKGAASVICDREQLFVNSSGSSALAKAGSGDALAGFLASLVAAGLAPTFAAALAAYLHGRAADSLSLEYSTLGVTPSDLPRQMARETAALSK